MTKIVIAGGGIGGTVTAMALQRAGIDAVVCESYDRSADGVGIYLQIALNGLQALGLIGLDEVVRELGFPTNAMSMQLGSGAKLGEFVLGDEPQRTLKRADLYQALRLEAQRRGIEVQYGKRIVGADSDAHGVQAHFADGTTIEADLLVGADGLKSRVRELIDPAAPRARYIPLLNTGGYAQGVTVDATPGAMNMVMGRKAFFAYYAAPGGEVWWFANPPMRREPAPGQVEAISQADWRAQLVDLFKGDNTAAVDIINATPGDLAKWPTYDFPNVPHWHRDRMVIIGDAAHAVSPASGQGASMAIEDSVVLAKSLRDIPDVDTALRAYEAARRDRVQRVVAQGKKNGDQKVLTPFRRVVRDMILKRMMAKPQNGMADELRWMWDHRLDWETPVA